MADTGVGLQKTRPRIGFDTWSCPIRFWSVSVGRAMDVRPGCFRRSTVAAVAGSAFRVLPTSAAYPHRPARPTWMDSPTDCSFDPAVQRVHTFGAMVEHTHPRDCRAEHQGANNRPAAGFPANNYPGWTRTDWMATGSRSREMVLYSPHPDQRGSHCCNFPGLVRRNIPGLECRNNHGLADWCYRPNSRGLALYYLASNRPGPTLRFQSQPNGMNCRNGRYGYSGMPDRAGKNQPSHCRPPTVRADPSGLSDRRERYVG